MRPLGFAVAVIVIEARGRQSHRAGIGPVQMAERRCRFNSLRKYRMNLPPAWPCIRSPGTRSADRRRVIADASPDGRERGVGDQGWETIVISIIPIRNNPKRAGGEPSRFWPAHLKPKPTFARQRRPLEQLTSTRHDKGLSQAKAAEALRHWQLDCLGCAGWTPPRLPVCGVAAHRRRGAPEPYAVCAFSRIARAAATMFIREGRTSSHLRVLRPQSGFTHNWPSSNRSRASMMRLEISPTSGTRGE